MNVVARFLYGIIIFQIALGSAFLSGPSAYAQPQNAPDFSVAEFLDTQLEQQVESKLAALNNAGENDLPGASEDVFHLTQQFLEFYGEGAKEDRKLAQRKNMMFMALPEVPYGDFDKEVAVQLNAAEKNISLVLSDKDGIVAKHVIIGFEPVSFARDKEMITFVDASGKVFAIDAGYARNRVFTGPLPVFEVADINHAFNSREQVTSHFVTRGLKPFEPYTETPDGMFPLDKPLTPEYTAGDLVIYSGADGHYEANRKMYAMLDRNVMQSIMYRNEVFILRLAQPFMRVSEANSKPNFSSTKVIERLNALLQSEANAPHAEYAAADPLTRKVFASIGLDSIQPLMAAAETNRAVQNRLRDRFAPEEGWQSFKVIHDEGVREREEQAEENEKSNKRVAKAIEQTLDASARPNTRQDTDYEEDAVTLEQNAHTRATTPPLQKGIKGFLHRALTSKAMKILGAITAVGAIGAGLYLGGHALLAGHGAYWAVHIFQSFYNHLWPAVLKDQVYRVTALQTAFWMSWSVPILWGIGALSSKLMGQKWSAQKGLAVVTWRVLAVLQFSFLKRLAKMTRQTQFIAALKRNVNPFTKVTADSNVGRQVGLKKDIHVGFNSPFLSKKDLAAAEEQGAKVLDALSYQSARGRALAWFLALMTTAEKEKVDPVTLAILAQNPKATAEEMEKTTGDANFRAKWMQFAQEYENVLKDFAATGVTEDVKDMSAAELKQFRVTVEATAAKIRSRGKLAQFAAKLKTKWTHFSDKALPYIGNYGEAENKILSKGVPDKFTETYWNGFWTDFYFTLAQDIVVGARAAPADLAKVHQAIAQGQPWPNTDLAANGSKPLKANPDFVAENASSTVSGPVSSSTLMLNYSSQGTILEDSYAPIEDRTLTQGETEDGYWSGMGAWLGGSLNIRRANYGVLWVKALFKKVATLQSATIIGLATRMIFGHKTLLNAGLGYFYMFFWANWCGSAIWTWVQSGNKIYQEEMAAREQVFRQAKTVLNQGLRFNDINQMRSGYEQLAKLYADSKVEIPEPVRKAMLGAEEFMNAPAAQVTAVVDAVQTTQAAQQVLVDAIDSKDQGRIDQASGRLRALYDGSEQAQQGQLFKLNAKTLLQFSLETPPFATKINKGVNTTSNLIGSPLTTYFVGFVSALTLHSTVGWGLMFAHMLPLSIGLYAASYFGQLIVNKYGDRIVESFKNNYAQLKLKFCKAMLIFN